MKRSLLLSLALLIACYTSSFAELSDTIWTHPIAGNVISVKFSPDGNYIYSGSTSNIVTKLEVSTNKVVKVFDTPKNLHSMDLSQDGKFLLLSGDTAMVLLDTETGDIYKTFVYPFYLAPDKDDYIVIDIKSVSFSFDGKYCGVVYNGGNSQTKTSHSSLIIWEVETGKVVLNRKDDNLIFESFSFSPTENILAVKYGHPNQNNKVPISVYEVETWKLLTQFEGNTETMNGLKFSKDGNFLASWSNGIEKIKIWDMKTLTLKPNTNGKYQIADIWDLCFLNDSTIIASANVLINSKLRWQYILINLNKQTKTVIADGGGGIDLSILNSMILLVTANYTGITLLNLDKTLDIQSDTQQPPIILFPNPVTKELTVTLSEANNTIITYRIINIAGNEVLNSNSVAQNGILKINVSNLPIGSYVLNLNINNTQHSIKFVKE